jgi:hypothetical protein
MAASPAAYGFAILTVANQTSAQPATATVLENSACMANVAYFTPTGQPYVPASVRYRIDDCASGQNIVPITGLAPGATSTITIAGTQNMLISLTRPSESHVLTVQITDAAANVFFASVEFNVVKCLGTS